MTLLLWLGWGEWRAQPVRNALSVAAIAIGVALGFAIHLVNAVALDDFTGGLNRVRGAADLSLVAADPAGFDEALYGRLMADDVAASIAVASPVVERDVTLADDPSIVLHVIGLDALRAIGVTPLLLGQPEPSSGDPDGDAGSRGLLAWFDADAIRVPAPLLARLGRKTGDPLATRVDGDVVPLRIAGALADDAAAPPAAPPRRTTDARPAAADDLRRRDGHRGRAVAAASAGAPVAHRPPSRRRRERRGGPDGTRAAAADRRPCVGCRRRSRPQRRPVARLSGQPRHARVDGALHRRVPGVFDAVARGRATARPARVAARRRTTRRRLVAQVLVEGAAQGIVGGLLGLVGGVAFAAAVLRFFGGDLGSGAFARSAFDLHRLLFAAPAAAVLFFLLGLVAALAGSFFPARAAALAAPAAALKSAGSDDASPRVSPWLAAALLAAGLGAASLPAIGGLPIAGYVAMALLLFGGIAAMPWIARLCFAPFARGRRPRPVAVDLALRRLWAAPSAASVALCGIVASASLMVAMTVMIASFRHSLDAWLGQLLSADLYLRTNAAGADGLSADDVERLRHVDGVARIEQQKVVPLNLVPSRPSVALVVRGIDPTHPEHGLPLVSTAAPKDLDGAVPVWVSEAMVDLYDASPGRPIVLPLATVEGRAAPRFVVAGVWRDYARQFGSVVMRRDDYVRLTGDGRFPDASIDLAHGARPAAVVDALRAALPPALRARAEFADPGTIRRLSLAIFDRSFAVTYLLQAVAIAIGLAGVAATFSAQTLARSKEFGMLRHIGVLKRQIVAELATEGALLGVLGAGAGAALGLAIGQVLIHVVNPQSFHWTMDTEVPWGTLSAVGLALVVAASGTAVLAGRRALGRGAVQAVREDW